MEENVTFEKAAERLEGIVRQLEGDEIALEQALSLFEEGIGLSRYCAKKLDEAERRVLELTEGADQSLVLRDFQGIPESE